MIFISYSRKDLEGYVQNIIDELRSEFGEEAYFLDTKNLEKGQEFLKEISDAIDKSDIFLPIITENYLTSDICNLEMNAFYLASLKSNRTKKLLPYYPKEIWDYVPLILKSVNSIIGKNANFIIEQLKIIRSGGVPRLVSFLSNKIAISKNYSNAVSVDFIFHDFNIRNPEVYIKPKMISELIELFGSKKSYINAFEAKWNVCVKVSNVETDNDYVLSWSNGIYLAGEKANIDILIRMENLNDESAKDNLINIIKMHGGFINIVDELKIIDTFTKKEIEILSILNKSLVFESNDGLQSPSINTVANNEDLLKKINELKKDIEESTTMDDATIVDFENIKIS